MRCEIAYQSWRGLQWMQSSRARLARAACGTRLNRTRTIPVRDRSQWRNPFPRAACLCLTDEEVLVEGLATVFKVKLFCALKMLCSVPHRLVSQHCVEDGQQLAHAGDDGHLLGLAGRDQAAVENLD